jgi:branched-chain amino acid transport system permease protein
LVVTLGAGAVVLVNPAAAPYATLAVIYALIGLSLNILVGYLGQLSLGHQGFVGIGALFTAYATTQLTLPLPVALVVGAMVGSALALLIGVAALRVRGLYLALVTLVSGLVLQSTVFQISAFTGGGAGEPANRPDLLLGDNRFYWLCLAVLVVVLYLDSSLMRSKAGRAMLAIKDNESSAAAFGVNVVGYKLLAFVLSGTLAGLAGGLFAFSTQQFNGNDFNFPLALSFLIMTVVGGAGSRSGVVAGSVLFALLNVALADFGPFRAIAGLFPEPVQGNFRQFGVEVVSAILLLLTLVVQRRGLATITDPVVSWIVRSPAGVARRARSTGD